MNKDIKDKWVSALRSGLLQQTTESLKDTEGFCCLGVLCEISAAETGFGIPENLVETYGNEDLGQTIRDWADIKNTHGGFVLIGGIRYSLTEANDLGKTFLEIAAAIEEQL